MKVKQVVWKFVARLPVLTLADHIRMCEEHLRSSKHSQVEQLYLQKRYATEAVQLHKIKLVLAFGDIAEICRHHEGNWSDSDAGASDIPEETRNEFYDALYRVLTMFNSKSIFFITA